jgi:hypothetical protein
MLQFLFAGKNYVGPVKEILTSDGGRRKSKVLDLGTGGGHWCVCGQSDVNRGSDVSESIPGPLTLQTSSRNPK